MKKITLRKEEGGIILENVPVAKVGVVEYQNGSNIKKVYRDREILKKIASDLDNKPITMGHPIRLKLEKNNAIKEFVGVATNSSVDSDDILYTDMCLVDKKGELVNMGDILKEFSVNQKKLNQSLGLVDVIHDEQAGVFIDNQKEIEYTHILKDCKVNHLATAVDEPNDKFASGQIITNDSASGEIITNENTQFNLILNNMSNDEVKKVDETTKQQTDAPVKQENNSNEKEFQALKKKFDEVVKENASLKEKANLQEKDFTTRITALEEKMKIQGLVSEAEKQGISIDGINISSDFLEVKKQLIEREHNLVKEKYPELYEVSMKITNDGTTANFALIQAVKEISAIQPKKLPLMSNNTVGGIVDTQKEYKKIEDSLLKNIDKIKI